MLIMKLICKHCNKYYTCNIIEEDKRVKCLKRRKYIHQVLDYECFTPYPYEPEPIINYEEPKKVIKKKNKFNDKNCKSLIEYVR